MNLFQFSSSRTGARLVLSTCALLSLICSSAAQGLIACWKADGDATDSSGNGHNGTLQNGAGFEPGHFGQAFSLDGVSQYVSVPSNPAWNFQQNDFTISLWANFSSISNDGTVEGNYASAGISNVFLALDGGTGYTDKWIFYYDGLGNLDFHENGPDSANGSWTTFYDTIAPSSVPKVGDWHMYSITRIGDTLTMYFDGTSLGTGGTPGLSVPFAASDLTIGQAEGAAYLAGGLDDIRIYGRGLSDSEIRGLVPEPAAWMAFGVPAALLLRRRRYGVAV